MHITCEALAGTQCGSHRSVLKKPQAVQYCKCKMLFATGFCFAVADALLDQEQMPITDDSTSQHTTICICNVRSHSYSNACSLAITIATRARQSDLDHHRTPRQCRTGAGGHSPPSRKSFVLVMLTGFAYIRCIDSLHLCMSSCRRTPYPRDAHTHLLRGPGR